MEVAHLGPADWTWEPTVLLGIAAVVAGYAIARRRGLLTDDDDVSPWFTSTRARLWFFAAGVLVGFLALVSPIDTGGDQYLFALHMVQHLLLMMVAPPLCLLGIVGMRRPVAGPPGRMRRVWAAMVNPWSAMLIFSAVLVVWHIPALYDATLTTEPIHVVEHLSFIAVGVIFWWPIVDPMRGQDSSHWVGALPKIAVLVASGIPPTVLGLIFAVAPHAFYDFYVRAPRLWGLTPVIDQQVAGVVMFGAGNLIYFAAVVAVFWRMFADPARDEEAAQQASG
ncbi:MAG: cytochrome c oxidase assembly protein [Candidatus Dormibacteraeota bacterium]|uniref:Cytochrome c oxidase assembly protein n=1 Tax=Candidatus Amunia macphersoniae TaxID=3127014 RepID=A0A934KPH6_9BACT|nr:cytochrome c oxidase assembly protein [Candidatus Dormibacteraeota bacterium]